MRSRSRHQTTQKEKIMSRLHPTTRGALAVVLLAAAACGGEDRASQYLSNLNGSDYDEPGPLPDAGTEPDAPTDPNPDPSSGPPTPYCFGDLLTVAEARQQELQVAILPGCSTYSVPQDGSGSGSAMPSPTTTTTTITTTYDGSGSAAGSGSGDYLSAEASVPGSGTSTAEGADTNDPRNCGYSDAQIEAHNAALAALSDFQTWFASYLESEYVVYAQGQLFTTSAMRACIAALQAGALAAAPPAAPAPVCDPPNQEYNCKGVVAANTYSYWNANSNDPHKSDSARGNTCTDTLWREPFFWERLLYAPWWNGDRRAQVLARSSAGVSRGGLASWETHTSCLRETESVRTKYRLCSNRRPRSSRAGCGIRVARAGGVPTTRTGVGSGTPTTRGARPTACKPVKAIGSSRSAPRCGRS